MNLPLTCNSFVYNIILYLCIFYELEFYGIPVSYTHLDVYKRQTMRGVIKKYKRRNNNDAKPGRFLLQDKDNDVDAHTLTPVSYTHLDVYKRQDSFLKHLISYSPFLSLWCLLTLDVLLKVYCNILRLTSCYSGRS